MADAIQSLRDYETSRQLLIDLQAKLRSNNASKEAINLVEEQLSAVTPNPLPACETREIALLLADLRGFMALSEGLPADQMVTLLNRYFGHMNRIIVRYGGVIDKYMGDSILVLFGVNDSEKDDFQRAAACAIEMQCQMDVLNEENSRDGFPALFMGIGLNFGTVTVATLGSNLHQERSVVGAEVNLTARIEAQTLRGQILIEQQSYQRIAHLLEVGPPNQIQVKGKSGLVSLVEVLATTWPKKMEVPRRELRSSPRVAVDMAFDFQLLDGKEVLPEIYQGRIKDISYNGIYAILPLFDETVSELKLSLSLSLMSGHKKDIYARIHQKKIVDGQLGCGIEFTAVDTESQRVLKHFVDHEMG